MDKIKLIKKFIYNVIATTLPTILLQLLILPMIAKKMDATEYGLVLTIIALVMMLAAGVGNVINNVHMLSNSQYKEKGYSGDYGIFFGISIVAISIIIVVVSWKYGIDSFGYCALNVLFGAALLTKEYYIVYLWIDLDYWGILKCNLLCCVGYFIGAGVYWLGGRWQIIYIIGNALSIIYIYRRYGVSKVNFHKTPFFSISAFQCICLSIATILSRAMQYADRMLLYPLLGGEEVSIYYASTLMGKTIAMALGPINSFLLSQLAKQKIMRRNVFGKLIGFATAVGVVGYFVCLLLSKPILTVLYPQWAEIAMDYIYVTTGTAMLSAISMVISPIVMRFCNMSWQIVIQGVCLLLYVGVSLLMLNWIGLMGFCIGGLIANFATLVLMSVIFWVTNSSERETSECVG